MYQSFGLSGVPGRDGFSLITLVGYIDQQVDQVCPQNLTRVDRQISHAAQLET